MWEAFLDLIFWVIQSLYNLVGDWGMAILIVTIVFRAVITPLMYTQSKSSYRMQQIQPLVNEIKERFPDDPVRQNQETQKLYAETKFNPLAGCVPMLIQMPIFIALFQVLRSMGERVSVETSYQFYNLVPNLTASPADMWGEGIGAALPYLILLAIFALCTFIPTILQQKNQKDSSQRNQMLIMMAIMTVMMIWIGWSSPAGVLLFWGASSIFAIIQQQGSLYIIKKKDAESEKPVYEIPVDITVERKVKKKRQSKKR